MKQSHTFICNYIIFFGPNEIIHSCFGGLRIKWVQFNSELQPLDILDELPNAKLRSCFVNGFFGVLFFGVLFLGLNQSFAVKTVGFTPNIAMIGL